MLDVLVGFEYTCLSFPNWILSLLYAGSRDERVGSILINSIAIASFSKLHKVNNNNNNDDDDDDDDDDKLPCWTIFSESGGE